MNIIAYHLRVCERLRCNAKACILVPSLTLYACIHVFVCLRCVNVYGLIWYENQIGFSVRANTSISECGSLWIFCLVLVAVIIYLWMETSSIRWHSSFYWNLHIFYLHFVIVNAVWLCVWYRRAYGKTAAHFEVKVEVEKKNYSICAFSFYYITSLSA